MSTSLSDIKFLNSVIQWLSEFPGSPVLSISTSDDLTKPKCLFELFRILLHEEDFEVEIPMEKLESLFDEEYTVSTTDEDMIIPLGLNEQAKYLTQFVLNYFSNSKKRKTSVKKAAKIEKIVHEFTFIQVIIFKELDSIIKIAELLLRLGTFSTKTSTFGLTSLQFLSDADRMSINDYFGTDFDELINNDTEEMSESTYQERLKALENEKNLEIINETNKFNLEKLNYFKIIDNLKEVNETLSTEYNRMLKHVNIDHSSDVSYIDEEYINSVNWENNLYESLIYNLAMH